MLWARMLSYVTGTVNQELLLRNEYLGAENRILRGQIKGRLLLSEGEKATLAEIAQRGGRKALEELAAVANPDTLLAWSYGQKLEWIGMAQLAVSSILFKSVSLNLP